MSISPKTRGRKQQRNPSREVQAPNEKVSQGHLHQMAAPLQLEMSMKKQWKKQF
jgi:hypothetical protein